MQDPAEYKNLGRTSPRFSSLVDTVYCVAKSKLRQTTVHSLKADIDMQAWGIVKQNRSAQSGQVAWAISSVDSTKYNIS